MRRIRGRRQASIFRVFSVFRGQSALQTRAQFVVRLSLKLADNTSMRYVMKQKWLSWGTDFTIQDSEGTDRFHVDGAALSFGNKLSFQDMARNELAFISQKLLSWGPTYEIYRQDRLVAVVKKEVFTFFRCKFTVDVPGPDDLEAQGDFLDREYSFSRGNEVVASVSKKWFKWTDTYGIDVTPGNDDVLILASAVVIDLACHNGKRR
ncbi:MAG: LURP-one-related/scramblase family protein [Limisphaerales bacterium]